MKQFRIDVMFVLAPLALIVGAHALVDVESEPYFNNDETRHVMTGVFVRDALADGAWKSPKDYSVRYYLQYPALGLIVWPPFFYGVEGVWMTVFGTSFTAAKALLGLFGALAGIYFYRLVSRWRDRATASAALLLFGLMPLIFGFSRQVMLELPCLAFVLAAVFHFERYLDAERRRDAWLTGALAGLAALTRFDAVVLIAFFAIRLIFSGRLRLVKRGPVIGGVILAIALAAPYYLWTWKEYGSTISKNVKEGSSEKATTFPDVNKFVFYPASIPEQIGWTATVAAGIGLLSLVRRDNRRGAGPWLALIMATYLTFTPIAEMAPRHAIYWVPALAAFAALGCAAITRLANRPGWAAGLVVFVAGGAAFESMRVPHLYVRGYEEAAEYVIANTRETRVCLMDGFLNGAFIYQVRRHDPDRRLWTIRGDKLLYSMLCDPHAGYEEYAREEAEVIALIHRYDPELIIVEEPQIYFDLPGATLLRRVLRDHPERFTLEKSIPIRTNHFRFANARLEIWRNHVRNPQRSEKLEIEMMAIGRSLGTELK